MKSFYGDSLSAMVPSIETDSSTDSYIGTRARVAVYDAAAAAPYVEEVGPAPAKEYIDSLAVRVFELARQRGGPIPYTVVREIAENLIHAGFAEPIVSVMDGGHTIRFSDQGPGIPDKDRALQPGFTTATSKMKDVIRGVGSGLPIVRDFLSVSGGLLSIEDNLDRGAVVTVSCVAPAAARQLSPEARASRPIMPVPVPMVPTRTSPVVLFDDEAALPAAAGSSLRLSTRQKQVLALVLESGSAGPSLVSRELGVGLSTAYRDLASLEDLGLISSESGKRTLTEEGLTYLGAMSSASL